jgi:hypothetical protein
MRLCPRQDKHGFLPKTSVNLLLIEQGVVPDLWQTRDNRL